MWQYTGKERPQFAIEPANGQESVWDYPRPPALVADDRLVVVKLKGDVVAESSKTIRVLETASPPTFYIPPDDVNFDLLVWVWGKTTCEWKGDAKYYGSVKGWEEPYGWMYEYPTKRFEQIKEYMSFFPQHAECTVAGERVRPQGGKFYGGWVTDEIVGPWKGVEGTGGW